MCSSFINHFIRNPGGVGAIVPLQGPVISEMIKDMKNRPKGTKWAILEVGAGFGNISESLLKLMSPEDTLDLVEIDSKCCAYLKQRFGNDPRVRVICSSILDWQPKQKYNLIVSTLPLNNFELNTVEAVFKHYLALSHTPSLCAYVEYMGLEKLKQTFSPKSQRSAIDKRRQYIRKLHERYLVEKNPVYCNFLPCHVYHLKLQNSSVA